MSKLQLSIAIGDYDRMRPLVDGLVQIDGVDAQIMLLEPEEIFFRAFRHADFDICELSLSSYSVKTAAGTSPYVAVPVFPSRAFRHTSIYVRTDRIKSPADLKGCRIGVPEYQLTANIWVRMILEEDYGIRPADITWVRGGYEHPGRVEKVSLNLPADVVVENAGPDDTIFALLASGEIDEPRAVSSAAIPTSAIYLPTRNRLQPSGTGGPGFFRSCTRWESAARLLKSIPGCRSRSSRLLSAPRRSRWQNWATRPPPR
jgi:hypothetical protein